MEKKSSKNGGDVDNQKVELKKEILLFTYKCVYDKILSCQRLSYQIGFWTLTAIILTVGYAFSNKQYLLLSTIPFIFVVGASIYYHVMMSSIYHARYNFEIERKIEDLTNLDLLDIEHQCGIFGKRVSSHLSHRIPLVASFLIAFAASIGIGAYYAIQLLEWYEWRTIITIYILMSITLVYFVLDGIFYVIKQRIRIEIDLKKEKTKEKRCVVKER